VKYEIHEINSYLRPGEILQGLVEHRVVQPPITFPEGEQIEIRSREIDYSIILNAECDLEWDFKRRFPTGTIDTVDEAFPSSDDHHKALPHLIMCMGETLDSLGGRSQIRDSDHMNLIKQNQDERYGYIPQSAIDGKSTEIPELVFDFKKVMALPTRSIYEGIRTGGARRVAALPSPWNLNMANRFFNFHGRIGLPD